MMHEQSILALAFSKDSDLIASGSQDGKIKVTLANTLSIQSIVSHTICTGMEGTNGSMPSQI